MRTFLPIFLLSAFVAFAAQSPEESAVAFVKKLKAGQVDLSPDADTALVSEISTAKKAAILERLKRLASDLEGEKIEIGPTRIEGALAGVILRVIDPSDANQVRVLPLAMVRKDDQWRVAPVLASFENTPAAYSRASRTLAQEVEIWLAREQVNEVERMRKSAADLFRKSLADSLSPATLRKWTPRQAFAEFLAACEKSDTPRILALLGGLSDPLPENWAQMVSSVTDGIATAATGSDTISLLSSPAVLRIPIGQNNRADTPPTSFRVLFLDPRSGDQVSIREQTFAIRDSSEGLPVIAMPESKPPALSTDEISQSFQSQLTQVHPPQPQVTAENLKKLLLESLQCPTTSSSWARLIHQGSDAKGSLAVCMRATAILWEARNPTDPVIPVELGFQQEDDRAYVAIQWLSLGKLVFSPRVFHLQKHSDGWVWNVLPDPSANASAEKWVKNNEADWKKSFLKTAVGNCPQPDHSLAPPEESQASALVKKWHDAVATSHWSRALSLCARLGTEDSPTLLLRNLGYEAKAARRSETPVAIDQPMCGKTVTLVAIRSRNESREIQSLIPLVSTAEGPRILLEIDLGASTRPGRAFLNRNALARLASVHPKVAEELKEMVSEVSQEEKEGKK